MAWCDPATVEREEADYSRRDQEAAGYQPVVTDVVEDPKVIEHGDSLRTIGHSFQEGDIDDEKNEYHRPSCDGSVEPEGLFVPAPVTPTLGPVLGHGHSAADDRNQGENHGDDVEGGDPGRSGRCRRQNDRERVHM